MKGPRQEANPDDDFGIIDETPFHFSAHFIPLLSHL